MQAAFAIDAVTLERELVELKSQWQERKVSSRQGIE
jgi:hypothetical protein